MGPLANLVPVELMVNSRTYEMDLPCVDSSHPTLGLAAAVVGATVSSLAASAIAVDHGPVLGQHEQSGSTYLPTTRALGHNWTRLVHMKSFEAGPGLF